MQRELEEEQQSWNEVGESDLQMVAEAFVDFIGNRKHVVLDGGMGAGKTTLSKALLLAAGYEGIVDSPTYTLVNEYDTSKWGKVYHMDLYRVRSEEELHEAGIIEMVGAGAEKCIIEWAELIMPCLSNEYVLVEIEVVENDKRRIVATIKKW